MMCTIQQCNKVRTSKNTQARYRGANILRNIGIDIPIKNIDKTAENLAEAINQHTYLKERILMGSDWYMTEMAVYSMGSYYNSMFEIIKTDKSILAITAINMKNTLGALNRKGEYNLLTIDNDGNINMHVVHPGHPEKKSLDLHSDSENNIMWVVRGRGIYFLDLEYFP